MNRSALQTHDHFQRCDVHTLNKSEAMARLKHEATFRQIMRMHGIPVLPNRVLDRSLAVRQYRVLLVQHQVVRIWMAQGKAIWLEAKYALPEELQYEDVTIQQEEPEVKRAIQWSARSMYAIGIDVGMVEIAVMSELRMSVVGIKAEPADLALYENEIALTIEALADESVVAAIRQEDVVLGADPEFALRDRNGNMDFASRYIGRQGEIGYDTARYREKPNATLHPLAELRPKPSAEPNALFHEMYRTMQRAATKWLSPEVEWLAGGMPFEGYPLGGHIHFSGVLFTQALVRKLDSYLALPLVLVEDEGCKKRRPRYGFLGDVRMKEHGGFEYRTLPSWLVSPRMTKGILALAKVVASSHHALVNEALERLSIQAAYYQGDKKAIRPIVKDMWQELSSLPLYEHYRHSLDPFFAEVLASRPWSSHLDIRHAWKLTVPAVRHDVTKEPVL